MSHPEVAATVIGGGIVGCAVLDALARRGLAAVLLEREPALARGTTSRSSEVAHGGMYYPAGTLKARFCVEGRRLLEAFCREAGVGYRECGKLIVAVDDAETDELQRLHDLGFTNGVEDLALLDAAGLARLEPEVRGVAALHSPRTGILDAEGAAVALARRAVEAGGLVMTGAAVEGLEPVPGGWRVQVAATGRREAWSHISAWVVNTAGLTADRVADMAGSDLPAQVLVKGNYFGIAPRHAGRMTRLVYPVPPADDSSLGVHLCLDLAGQMRLGPDTEFPDPGPDPLAPDYAVDPARRDAFLTGAQRFLPWLAAEDLGPDTSGLRPKLHATEFRDFLVDVRPRGAGGLVNLLGIDSPGLTSAPALAEHVADLIAA